MNRGILDTSVIVKSIFKPPKSLSSEIYKRELETHKKCKFVVKKIEEIESFDAKTFDFSFSTGFLFSKKEKVCEGGLRDRGRWRMMSLRR